MSYKPSVAIIGTSGFLGKPILEAFESDLFADKFQFPIKAVSRNDKPSTDKVQYVKGSLDESEVDKLVDKLKGTDVIIELLGPNPSTFSVVESLVKAVRPKLFIPSQFGCEIDRVDPYAPGFLGLKTVHSNNLRDSGIKVVDVISSFFAIPGSFLYEIVQHAGIDPESKSVTYRGSPETKISVSRMEDIGKSVASLASLDPSKIPNKVRIQSDVVTLKDVVERYEKTHNIKLTIKGIVSKEDTLKEFQDKYAKGFNPDDFLFYLNAIAAQGLDKGALFSENENELVNPGESLWKWGKY